MDPLPHKGVWDQSGWVEDVAGVLVQTGNYEVVQGGGRERKGIQDRFVRTDVNTLLAALHLTAPHLKIDDWPSL